MSRFTTVLLITILLLLVMIEPTLAENKFTRIGGGVSGSNREKYEILKNIGAIFGGFLVLLGILSFATRKRYEGFLGMVTGKGLEAATVVPIVLIVLGSLITLFCLI